MENAPRVLLILFEGLPATVIDSQVLVHVREMANLGIAEFEVWTFASSAALYKQSMAAQARAQERAGCPVRVFRGVRPAVPLSSVMNALRLWMGLVRFGSRFDLVHARTDYAAVVCRLLKRFRGFRLIWDCRGDSPAEFAERFRPENRLLHAARAIRKSMLERDRRRAARSCDRAIFVSSTLETLAAPLMGSKPRQIIPCTASETLFRFDPSLRDEARRDLGFDSDSRVYIFSGSLAPYQCFDETLALFGDIRSEDPGAQLLILTPAQEEARRRLASHPAVGGIKVCSAPIDEVNRYLNAADAAIMLRAETAINRAAFPTKFAEYCLTGLPVIMTPSVPDAYAMAQRLGNLLPMPPQGAVAWPEQYDRNRTAAAARSCLSRTSVTANYAQIYADSLADAPATAGDRPGH